MNLPETHRRLQLLLPYSKAGLISEIRELGRVDIEDYREDGVFVEALVDIKICHKVQDYIIKE